MKEVLFDFVEFKERLDDATHKTLHYAFQTSHNKDWMFESLVFRIYYWQSDKHLIIFEKGGDFFTYDEDKKKEWSMQCKSLASEIEATPGYYEEEVKT